MTLTHLISSCRHWDKITTRSLICDFTLHSHYLPYLTCKGEEHPSRPEQVVPPFPEREDDTKGAQDHEEQTEDGDGCCWDIVLWEERRDWEKRIRGKVWKRQKKKENKQGESRDKERETARRQEWDRKVVAIKKLSEGVGTEGEVAVSFPL